MHIALQLVRRLSWVVSSFQLFAVTCVCSAIAFAFIWNGQVTWIRKEHWNKSFNLDQAVTSELISERGGGIANASLYRESWGTAPSGIQERSPWSGCSGGKAPLKLRTLVHKFATFLVFCKLFSKLRKYLKWKEILNIMPKSNITIAWRPSTNGRRRKCKRVIK